MRKLFVAGNWKMNTDRAGARKLAADLAARVKGAQGLEVAVCPPFVYLDTVKEAVAGSAVKLGAQNCYFEPEGAFTGEVSAKMLKDVPVTYVILGHSERRHVLNETNELIARKVVAALGAGLEVILCVGELLKERQGGAMKDVVRKQIETGLFGLTAGQMSHITVAYEPVWAIGTGVTASPADAQEVHAFIRELVKGKFGPPVADSLVIQYGGSVKPDNAFELLGQPDIDGSLVGGAALKVDSFMGIIEQGMKAKSLV